MASETKKKRKNSYLGIIIAVVAIIVFFLLYIKFSVKATTKVAYHGEAEKVFQAKGIAVFDEELITSDKKGVAIINYSDGTRVLSKTHVATIYSGEIDESKSNLIKQLNEKINYLETNMKNQYEKSGKNSGSSESIIGEKMKKISGYSQSGNLENTLSESAELKSLIASNNKTDFASQITTLKNQRDDAESSISGSKENYISKTAGAIYSATDGYETLITSETIKDADTKTFQSLWNSKPVDYEKTADTYVYGKILNNYELHILSLVDAKDAEGLSEESTVYIRLSSQRGSSIPAIIKKINTKKGKALITLRVTKNIESFLSERKFSFEFIKETYKGLRVPKEAIMEENGEKYVYVVKDGIVRKRKLEILYESGDVIVKENNSNEDGLLLYDLIIVKSKNISEGMVIGY